LCGRFRLTLSAFFNCFPRTRSYTLNCALEKDKHIRKSVLLFVTWFHFHFEICKKYAFLQIEQYNHGTKSNTPKT